MADSVKVTSRSNDNFIKSTPSGPRVVNIYKTETGFGFNVRGQVSEGGQLRSINGELYAPLQHVSAVLEGGAAEKAGIRKGDRILEVNSVNVEGATHKQVVDLIKSGGDILSLTVISVTPQEAERLEPSEDTTSYNYIDYSEKRSLPISIPDYHYLERDGERFAVFNIYMAGRHLCSRRYREFSNLHSALKKEFVGFNFPKLPGKWPFTLSGQQVDQRRRGLELYLEKVCAVRVIAESDVMHQFLTDTEDQQGNISPVDLKVLLPDREVITVTIRKNSNANDVYQAVVDKIHMSSEASKYFYLFEIVEYNFERKLQPTEYPHSLYIQNYSTASSTCLCIRRWLFSPSVEMSVKDDHALLWFFWLAVDAVDRGHVITTDRLYQLKALQDASRKNEYLSLARELGGYGEIVFPHCGCDCRKEGHVIASVGFHSFKLHACKIDGTPESQVIEFPWTTMKQWEVDEEGMSFSFQYQKGEKNTRWVKILTPYFTFMFDCFERIQEEREWSETGE
ncbi:sorting nexin-27 [Halyomorpha halys]|uniref:sorting nexin-27 n=1 Tax=Halyomorpha halys TaxID=286706 RepID=UPI000D0C74EF|nr:sorting nexin-27 [Halyomorpha halys]XP_024214457.1 sorting nexin-27 [Halyomorpha halys]XP_024214458.1 sorting nexin-27 [Halyomorpha halys]XP_024214459.1 sorting nexin-27 [Halyomorpha halys]XP_024214460.1 sorting nexin-27 [Halyomorpha halys]